MGKIGTNWLTLPEAAEYLRCGERLLRELVTNERIPHVSFAGKALFFPSRLDKWLLAQEIGWATDKHIKTQEEVIPEKQRKIKDNCPQNEVNDIIKNLMDYKEGKELFVNGLGMDLCDDLKESNYKILSERVYARLSRWCHPKRETPRNKWVRDRARHISNLLYGKVIERTVHPSYRG